MRPSWVFLEVKSFAESEILSNAKSSNRFEREATAVKRFRRSDAEGSRGLPQIALLGRSWRVQRSPLLAFLPHPLPLPLRSCRSVVLTGFRRNATEVGPLAW